MGSRRGEGCKEVNEQRLTQSYWKKAHLGNSSCPGPAMTSGRPHFPLASSRNRSSTPSAFIAFSTAASRGASSAFFFARYG